MHYLIDGYNLLFRISTVLEDFSAGREAIIQDLNRKASRLNMDLILVFDAPGREGEAYRTHYNQLEIIFSAEGETADELILKILKGKKGCADYTVVTSDNQLAWRARHLGAKTEMVDSFLIKLNKQYLNALRKESKTLTLPDQKRKKVESKEILSDQVVEGSFEYYLEIFEKNIQPAPVKEERKREVESDLERWLRIFEERLRNGA